MSRDGAARKVLDTIADMFSDPLDELGDEWFTVGDVERQCATGYRRAYEMCKKKVASGDVEMKRIGRNIYFRFIEDDGAIGG